MNNFVALSVVGGSLNTWGTTLNTLLQAGGIGALTAELYNDGGTLKLSKGKIGINNGVATGIGVCIIDTITTISTAGMTAGLWHAIEVSVSGTAVTISITPIVGASDESMIDAATKAAYDYEKTGYYLTASKRLIGVVFLRAALALGRIVNCESGKLGFKGIITEDTYDSTGSIVVRYIAKKIVDIGDWNMRKTAGGGTTAKQVTHNIGTRPTGGVVSIIGFIRDDSGSYYHPILGGYPLLGSVNPEGLGAVNTMQIKICEIDNSNIVLIATTGSSFDSTNFDATSYNRGWIEIKWIT